MILIKVTGNCVIVAMGKNTLTELTEFLYTVFRDLKLLIRIADSLNPSYLFPHHPVPRGVVPACLRSSKLCRVWS